MKYRQLNTNFWEDNYVLSLSTQEKIFFIYLFTNPKVNMCGIYELADRTICYSLGATLEELEKIKQKFENDRKYFFYEGWVFIANFNKHNSFSTAKPVLHAYTKEWNSIPKDVLSHFLSIDRICFEHTIRNFETFMKVMDTDTVMDKDKDSRVGPRLGYRVGVKLNEDVCPEDLPI